MVASDPVPTADAGQMSKIQKLAALLIILGPDTAAQILRTLSPAELEAVSAEMTRLPVITPELREQILSEMSEVAITAGTALRGGVDFAQQALEKAVGASKASDIMERVTPDHAGAGMMGRIADIETRLLFGLIRNEHPQTVALVVSYLRTEKCSELLGLFSEELREQVIERLATLGPTPVEVVEVVGNAIERRLTGKSSRALKQTGGVKSAADALNALNRNLSKSILATLEERNPELGEAIRQKMFAFADLVRIEKMALQKVMLEVDMRDLVLALKKADEVLKAKLLGAISKRAAETVKDEMNLMGAVKLKEVSAAQLRIIEVVRRLEESGEIELEAEEEGDAK
jgi:flagellar motor switch protein FliG